MKNLRVKKKWDHRKNGTGIQKPWENPLALAVSALPWIVKADLRRIPRRNMNRKGIIRLAAPIFAAHQSKRRLIFSLTTTRDSKTTNLLIPAQKDNKMRPAGELPERREEESLSPFHSR
jgi:hypothetical protein